MNIVRMEKMAKHSHLVTEFASLRRGKFRGRLEKGLRSIGWLEPEVEREEYDEDEWSSSESESGDCDDRKGAFSGSPSRCQRVEEVKRPDDRRCQLMRATEGVKST